MNIRVTHLPDMLVRELFVAELAVVEVLAQVDVPVHPHVVAGGVVLATLSADVSLLTTWTHWSQHEPLLHLTLVSWRIDGVQCEDVVRVGVWDVFSAILCLHYSVSSRI